MNLSPLLPSFLCSSRGLQRAWIEWSGWLWEGHKADDFPEHEQEWIQWIRGPGWKEWQRLLLELNPTVLASMMTSTAASSSGGYSSSLVPPLSPSKALFSLQHYPLPEGTTSRGVVLLIPPCSHRATIFDIDPEHSVVQKLLEQGHQVVVLEWQTPVGELSLLEVPPTWMAYREAIISALQSAYVFHASLHVMGLCLGGAMILETITHPELCVNVPPIQSITLLSTLLDYHASGALSCLQWEPLYRALKQGLGSISWLPATWIYAMCCMVVPSGLGAGSAHIANRSSLVQWSKDGLMVSAPLALALLKALCADNALLHPKASGEASPLSALNIPLYIVGGLKDRLVPIQGLFNGLHHCKPCLPIRISLFDAGHLRCFLPGRLVSGYQGNWQGESLERWGSAERASFALDWIQDWGRWIERK